MSPTTTTTTTSSESSALFPLFSGLFGSVCHTHTCSRNTWTEGKVLLRNCHIPEEFLSFLSRESKLFQAHPEHHLNLVEKKKKALSWQRTLKDLRGKTKWLEKKSWKKKNCGFVGTNCLVTKSQSVVTGRKF